MKSESELTQNDLEWAARCAVLYESWVQLRYHRRRERFFDLCDKFTKASTAIIGATLFGQALKDLLPWFAGAISVVSLLSLVYAYSDRKYTHRLLSEHAAKIIGDIEAVPAGELTPGKIANWRADHARLCAKAPPPLKTLTLICAREQSIVDGHPNHVPPQAWWRRAFCHFG